MLTCSRIPLPEVNEPSVLARSEAIPEQHFLKPSFGKIFLFP